MTQGDQSDKTSVELMEQDFVIRRMQIKQTAMRNMSNECYKICMKNDYVKPSNNKNNFMDDD